MIQEGYTIQGDCAVLLQLLLLLLSSLLLHNI